jgi:hypothetical protein
MFIDNQLMMSDAQNFATVAIATASTSYIDMTVAGKAGNPLWIIVKVETAFICAGSNPTLTVAIQSDSDSAFGTATSHYTYSTIAEATLVDEYVIAKVQVPDDCGRYLRVYYTPSAAFDAGKVDAFVTMNPDRL